MSILKERDGEVAEKFGDERRTEIMADQGEFTVEDLIAEEDMVITISHSGYIKRIPVTTYQRQRRGGRGPHRRRPQGRRLGRAPVHRQHPRLPAVLHQRGPGLLAQGARDPAGRPRGARQAGRQLHHHQARRADRGAGAGARVHRRQVPDLRHPERHGEEDGALGVRQRPHQRHQRHQHRGRRRADRRPGRATGTTTSSWPPGTA